MLPRSDLAPAWFAALVDGTWSTIAASGWTPILPSPYPLAQNDSTTYTTGNAPANSVAGAMSWSGASVDQKRGEYIMAAGGGHGDGSSNAGYALALRVPTPAWRLLTNPTPTSQMGLVYNGDGVTHGGVFLDGRPYAMHSCCQAFGDGKVWYLAMNSCSSSDGGSVRNVLSYDRDLLGTALAPLAYTSANTIPWALWGALDAAGSNLGPNYGFGPGFFDRATNSIFGVANGQSSAGTAYWWQFSTKSPVSGTSTGHISAITGDCETHNGGIAWDLRIIPILSDGTNGPAIYVLNIDPQSPGNGTWSLNTTLSGTFYFNASDSHYTGSCVYCAQNRKFIVGSPLNAAAATNGNLYVMAPPTQITNGRVIYNPSGTWTSQLLTPLGGPVYPTNAFVGQNNNSVTKFNIVEDMGNGQSAIVFTPRNDQATFVYKIPKDGPASTFPLSVSPNGRYLQTASGAPFLINGDSPWSGIIQLTAAQMDTYLNDRQAKGINALIVNAIGHLFSSQLPPYNDPGGFAPFTGMSATAPYASNFSTAGAGASASYWAAADYFISGCAKRGIAVFVDPAFWGVNTSQGWQSEVIANTAGNLQLYGQFLANRWGSYGNVVWLMGGDFGGTAATAVTLWNIALGITSILPGAVVTAEATRSTRGDQAFGSATTGGQTPGFNLNTIYCGETHGSTAGYLETSSGAAAYALSPTLPFLLIESGYENEGATNNDLIRQPYATILAGGCGHFFGNNPVWSMGDPNAGGNVGAATVVANDLNTNGQKWLQYVPQLFRAYDWTLLVPKTDASFVTTSLSSGTNVIAPALSNDGTFGIILFSSSNAPTATVNLAALTVPTIRARWYDPTSGAYSTAGAGTYTNVGTAAFTTPGNNSGGFASWLLVLDRAP